SALTFSVGAALPLLLVLISPIGAIVPMVAAASLGFLALLGAIGARAGGANVLRATTRVTLGRVGNGSYRRYWEGFRNGCLTPGRRSVRLGNSYDHSRSANPLNIRLAHSYSCIGRSRVH